MIDIIVDILIQIPADADESVAAFNPMAIVNTSGDKPADMIPVNANLSVHLSPLNLGHWTLGRLSC